MDRNAIVDACEGMASCDREARCGVTERWIGGSIFASSRRGSILHKIIHLKTSSSSRPFTNTSRARLPSTHPRARARAPSRAGTFVTARLTPRANRSRARPTPYSPTIEAPAPPPWERRARETVPTPRRVPLDARLIPPIASIRTTRRTLRARRFERVRRNPSSVVPSVHRSTRVHPHPTTRVSQIARSPNATVSRPDASLTHRAPRIFPRPFAFFSCARVRVVVVVIIFHRHRASSTPRPRARTRRARRTFLGRQRARLVRATLGGHRVGEWRRA